MKASIIASILVVFLLIVYVLGINFYAYGKLSSSMQVTQDCETDSCGLGEFSKGSLNEEIGVVEKISVQVVRNRWYGKIIENQWSDGKNLNNLYLFKKLRIPMNVNGVNLIPLHVLVPIILILAWILILITDFTIFFVKNRTERRDQENVWIS